MTIEILHFFVVGRTRPLVQRGPLGENGQILGVPVKSRGGPGLLLSGSVVYVERLIMSRMVDW
jgi:hypothetical protein